MDVVPLRSFFPRHLALILLISVLDIQTSLASPVNQVYRSKDNSNIQNQILAFLLRRNVLPARETDVIGGLKLASKIAELQKLAVLQEELSLERQLVSNAIEKERSMPKKRDDACFWKYCV